MSLDTVLRHIVLIFSLATLPALYLLIKHLIEDETQEQLIRALLIILFLTLAAALGITVLTNVQLLYFGYEVKEIAFLSNLRNLLKTLSLFFISWALVYIRR